MLADTTVLPMSINRGNNTYLATNNNYLQVLNSLENSPTIHLLNQPGATDTNQGTSPEQATDSTQATIQATDSIQATEFIQATDSI